MKVYFEIEISELSQVRLLTLNRQGYLTDDCVTTELMRRGMEEWRAVQLLRVNHLVKEDVKLAS